MSFERYTDCALNAFRSHARPADVVKRKQEILTGVAGYHNYTPDSVLYVGFNPAILAETASTIAVTHISKEAQEFLHNNGIQFTYIAPDQLPKFERKFESVIALDEYFTFASTDVEQRDSIINICKLATEYVITTCKDYKNQEFKDREFSIPALVRNAASNKIYLEFHDYNLQDRNSWKTTVHEIDDGKLDVAGPFDGRSDDAECLGDAVADLPPERFPGHNGSV